MTDGAPDFDAKLIRAGLFATSFWGEGIFLRSDDACDSPHIIGNTLLIPDNDFFYSCSQSLLNAASLHAMAHIIFGASKPLAGKKYNYRQRTLIELVEDVRIECLAAREFPVLTALWLRQWSDVEKRNNGFHGLCRSIAYALIKRSSESEEYIVTKALDIFLSNIHDINTVQFSVRVGLEIANNIGQMRLAANEKQKNTITHYQDDNSHLWEHEAEIDEVVEQVRVTGPLDADATKQQDKLTESDRGKSMPLESGLHNASGDMLVPVDTKDPFIVYNYSENKNDNIFSYPEWQYQLHRYRENWATVVEAIATESGTGSAGIVVQENRFILKRMEKISSLLFRKLLQRKRFFEDGDAINVDDAVLALSGISRGELGALRVYEKNLSIRQEKIVLHILIDISASTSKKNHKQMSVLNMAGATAFFLSSVLERIGGSVAIEAFCSNGRADIKSLVIKTYDERDYTAVRNRLNSLHSHLSTRLGVSLRHGTEKLVRQKEGNRMLLLLTDGEPSDIDVFDRRYLVEDLKAAIEYCNRSSIKVFCLLLNPNQENAAHLSLRTWHHAVMRELDQLPETFIKIIQVLLGR